MKPGDLVMTKCGSGVGLVLRDGNTIVMPERTPALIIDTHDKVRNVQGEPLLRVLTNGVIGTLWPRDLEELNETG